MRYVWAELSNAGSFLLRKVEVHVGGELLEAVKQLLLWGAQNVVNFVNLVNLVSARKERE